MPAGSPLTPDQLARLRAAVARAEASTGLRFKVRVGSLPQGRADAESALATADDPASTVLVAVDPPARLLEIVTGPDAAARLDDRSCGLAALAMTSSFSAGDLVGGLVDGVRMLADHARSRDVKHLETF